MSAYIPYLVVLGVVLVFFFVCWLIFRETPKKEQTLTGINQDYYKRTRPDYGALYYDNNRSKEKEAKETSPIKVDMKDVTSTISNTDRSEEGLLSIEKEAMKSEENEKPSGTYLPYEKETTIELGKISNLFDAGEDMAETRVLSRDTLSMEIQKYEEETGKDFRTEEISDETLETALNTNTSQSDMDKMIQLGMANFVRNFGLIKESTKMNVEHITAFAISYLGIKDLAEWEQLLDNIVVQEALEYVQKSYAAKPEPWMEAIAVETFADVVMQPKSSTPYLIAFEALHILPHLSLPHFQAMAIILLIQYSRNSNNYSLDNFRHYVSKYIEPFMEELPREDSFFQQLDYLKCLAMNREKLSFSKLMSNSYPFMFMYRGFTEEEAQGVIGNEEVTKSILVDSVNSPMKKLAIVDETMAPPLFRKMGINDKWVQQHLLSLAKSKPTGFVEPESYEILGRISPVLLTLAQQYDRTVFATSGLTLLGLYLARSHVKATIGENFDLSRWLR